MSNMKKEQEKPELKFEEEEAYADANLFISLLSLEKAGEAAREIIDNVKKGNVKVYTAALTIDEVLWTIQKKKGKEIAYTTAKIIMGLPNLEFIPVSSEIIGQSLEIYLKEGMHPRDAIHLASMKSKNIKTIISSDPDFDKIKGIKRVDFTK